MGKTFFGLTASAVLGITLLYQPPFPASGGRIGVATAWAEEEFTYYDDEITFHFSGEKNLVHFNHLMGMLSDLWKTQNKVFDLRGKGENTVGAQVEDLLNDANLAASQGDYEAAFVSLNTVHESLKASLTQMGVKASK